MAPTTQEPVDLEAALVMAVRFRPLLIEEGEGKLKVEYKVIDTPATGVPLGTGKTYAEQLEAGLNALAEDGWILTAIAGSTKLIFVRLSRPRP